MSSSAAAGLIAVVQEMPGRTLQLSVVLQLVVEPFLNLAEASAKVLAIDIQIAAEVSIQLAQIVADVILGEDQDVVPHTGQQGGEEVLLLFLGFFCHPVDHVVGERQDPIEVAVVHLETNQIAQLAADRQVESADSLRHLLEQAGDGDGVIEPENTGQAASEAGTHGVLGTALQEAFVSQPSGFVALEIDGLPLGDGDLTPGLGVQITLQRVSQGGAGLVDENRKAQQRGGLLGLEKDSSEVAGQRPGNPEGQHEGLRE